MVGRGIRMEQIRRQVKEAGLEKAVHFLGWRPDVERIFQAMDVFVLPSHFEGLPTVGVEAQCTGLSCVLSDTITAETKITENCMFLPAKGGTVGVGRRDFADDRKREKQRRIFKRSKKLYAGSAETDADRFGKMR